jgi:hypothetical protein
MSAPALASAGRPTLSIRGTPYPVLLPTFRDPRLHLAGVIVSLQVLGQVAFSFRLSIAQILVSLGTCAVLEFAIAFRRQRVIMWPASALLTGNGVAFVLRVPGTEHGDWWSLHGWWIFVATAAVSLLSKHVVRIGGRHVFNPSNIGLVLCFLILGKNRADPLDFWWAPMSTWMAAALIIIVAGGLLILSRLHLLGIAVGFWLSFAAGVGILAASGHAISARWHLGPVSGDYFWWVLVTSPEVLVFLFFMITDPKTIPDGRVARFVYAVSVGLLATLLIAPQRTEFGAKVALLGALAIVCAACALVGRLGWGAAVLRRPVAAISGLRPSRLGLATLASAATFAGAVVLLGIPARTGEASAAAPVLASARPPHVTIARSSGVASQLNRPTALRIARDLVADLRLRADALRTREPARAAAGLTDAALADVEKTIRAARGGAVDVPVYDVESTRVELEPGKGQEPPTVVATTRGRMQTETYAGSPPMLRSRSQPVAFAQTLRLAVGRGGRFLVAGIGSAAPVAPVTRSKAPTYVATSFRGVRLTDVARQVGLDFRQDSFRFGVSSDPVAMMGGGLCWLDYDNDGWLDLFVVNSYADADIPEWQARGGLPRSALFHNVKGKFVNVTRSSRAGVQSRGEGCVAADFNGDGFTDIYETTAVNDVLLWNNGNGTFTDGTNAAGLHSFGWHSGAAVADVNGDGRPDLFVAGYTEPNGPIPGSAAGFPTNHLAVRDLLFLNEGNDAHGHARFREVAKQAGIERSTVDHGLGAVFTDVNGDGRPDLYVANDEDPNRLYLNRPWPGGVAEDPAGLGFRLVDRAARDGVADRNAGMGVAEQDYSGDGRPDIFVSNSRGQTHGIFRSDVRPGTRAFTSAQRAFAPAFGTNFTGWGASWADLDLDGNLDLVLANGAIPVTNLTRDAGPVQALENMTSRGRPGVFADASRVTGLAAGPHVNGRGLATADFDNNGTVDIAINTIGGPLVLLRNSGEHGHWLEVGLKGFHPGAVVTAVLPDGRRLVRVIQAGSSYLSSEDPRAHFGLGAADRVAKLIVRYPDGRERTLTGVRADRILRVP